MTKEILKQWEKATLDLTDYFVSHYFGRDVTGTYWIADDIGGCLYVNDHFFNLGDITDYIKYSYSKNKMFEYYEYQLKCIEEKKLPINIKTYRQLLESKE